jgi:hypothetical protein
MELGFRVYNKMRDLFQIWKRSLPATLTTYNKLYVNYRDPRSSLSLEEITRQLGTIHCGIIEYEGLVTNPGIMKKKKQTFKGFDKPPLLSVSIK